jgi:hypothetical protein
MEGFSVLQYNKATILTCGKIESSSPGYRQAKKMALTKLQQHFHSEMQLEQHYFIYTRQCSGSEFGSGSFYRQAKQIVRKTLISAILSIFFYFLPFKNDV